MYSLSFTETSRKFLKKLEKKDVRIIVKKIFEIRNSPFSYLKKLQGNKLWRLRITKFRAILDVVVSKKNIIVIRIGYRKNVYE